MTVALLLLVSALPMQGSLKATVEAAVTSTAEGRAVEIYYEIPHGSLVFTRTGVGFEARYQVRAQAFGRARRPLAGRVWDLRVAAYEYGATSAGDSSASGFLTMALPESTVAVSVEVRDLSSERRSTGRMEVSSAASGLALAFVVGDSVVGTRRFGIADTVRVVARAGAGVELDSCRFLLSSRGRVVTGRTAPAYDSAGARAAGFSYPVAGTDRGPRLRNGDYELVVTGFAAGGQTGAVATFRVDYPFHYDDSAYRARVEQLIYVATPEEIRRLKTAAPAERDSLWRGFWQSRDDVPSTGRNEREDEYFARIDYANEKFRHGDLGYRSDRGRVYVTYGPPDQVETRPFELDRPAYEIWHYYETGRSFRFIDRYGTGQYVLSGAG